MKITAKLAAKVGVLVGLSGVGITGVYLGGDYANNLLSKYEKALITFLNSNGGNDIVFEVKKKDDTMISYAGDTENSISAKVQIANGSSSAFRRIDEKAKDADKLMENIRHAGENWIWECAFNFRKERGVSQNDIRDKDRILGNDGEGLFGILKQEISKYTKEGSRVMDKDDLRRVKVEFIRQCGHERGVAKNRKINGGGKSSSGDIKVTVKTFQFSNRNGGEKLIPEEEERFGY